MAEINLVPDIKAKMLKTQKMRNLVIFICVIVVLASGGVLLILGGIKGGQDIKMKTQDDALNALSEKAMSYGNLSEFLTIQDQLGKIADISSEKKVLSRIFDVMEVLLYKGQDSITLSSLKIDLDKSTISFDAQADALTDPKIDYRVLEAFKKAASQVTYDYGRYVDENGKEIPTLCIVEKDDNGNYFTENGNMFAYWKKNNSGCNPSREGADEEVVKNEGSGAESTENMEKIWRTPRFDEWYKDKKMTLDGEINGVAHFESVCAKYSGIEANKSIKWSMTNDCKLLTSEDGVNIKSSSNGKENGGNLVLRFSAEAEIDPEIFEFNNKHMIAINPAGQDVTDSYTQIQNMFAERASDCEKDDDSCSTNTKNSTGK